MNLPIPTGILSGAANSLGTGTLPSIPSSSASSANGPFQGGGANQEQIFGSGVRGFVNNFAAKGAKVDSGDNSSSTAKELGLLDALKPTPMNLILIAMAFIVIAILKR